MSCIRILEIVSYPRFDIRNFWKGVSRSLLAGIQLCETNTEAKLVNIRVWNNIIGSCWNWRVDEKLNQTLCRQCPALGVSIYECL